jgi:hypothetical protein
VAGGGDHRTSAWSSAGAWWLEAILAGWGIDHSGADALTHSYASFGRCSVSGMVAVWNAAAWLQRRRAGNAAPVSRSRMLGMRAVMVLAFLVACAAGLYGAARVYSRIDPRMVRLFQTVELLPEVRAHYPNEVLYELANRVAFAERIAYWEAGFRTFATHPVLGVGFGNSGFFLQDNLPGYAFRLTEIRDLISGEFAGLPNPKNLWIRLLAETGLLGFAAFLTWWILLGAGALLLWRRGSTLERLIGCAGCRLDRNAGRRIQPGHLRTAAHMDLARAGDPCADAAVAAVLREGTGPASANATIPRIRRVDLCPPYPFGDGRPAYDHSPGRSVPDYPDHAARFGHPRTSGGQDRQTSGVGGCPGLRATQAA